MQCCTYGNWETDKIPLDIISRNKTESPWLMVKCELRHAPQYKLNALSNCISKL